VTSVVDHALLDEAVALTREAGRRTLRYFQSATLGVEQKADGSPVTDADRDAERFVRDTLAGRYPHDSVIGEEHDDTHGSSGRVWTVDPIDGTFAFVHGVPLYSTLLAVDDQHGPAIGVIHLPALNETVYAGRGLGCFHDGRRSRVSEHADPVGALVVSSGLWWAPAALRRVIDAGANLRTWGDGYGYALVATGRADAMVDPVANPWDIAPMPVILAEAGGAFTDTRGVNGITHGSGLATNGHLHPAIVRLLTDG
jgi:histidinol-phosphatase